MRNVQEISSGYTFGYFTVVKEAPYKIRNNGQKVRMWECRCECGNVRYLNRREIVTEKRKSCGCKFNELQRLKATVHGDSHTRLHNIWSGMRERCYTKSDFHYKWYGERGIKMCDEWKDDYVTFKEWAVSNGYSEQLTIDRINVDGDYSPENCRWVTLKVNANNKRNNHRLNVLGGSWTLSELEDMTGINQETIRHRLRLGWSEIDAIKPLVRKAVAHG